jgi:hypothetical protein
MPNFSAKVTSRFWKGLRTLANWYRKQSNSGIALWPLPIATHWPGLFALMERRKTINCP